MRKTLLWIHLASVAVFAGATALMLVQMASFTPMSPESFAAVRETVSTGARDVVLPALLVMVASGMLLVVARPMLIEARWVWAKAAVGLALAAFVLLMLVMRSLLKNGRAKAIRFSTLDGICEALECQPGDVMEWVEE